MMTSHWNEKPTQFCDQQRFVKAEMPDAGAPIIWKADRLTIWPQQESAPP